MVDFADTKDSIIGTKVTFGVLALVACFWILLEDVSRRNSIIENLNRLESESSLENSQEKLHKLVTHIDVKLIDFVKTITDFEIQHEFRIQGDFENPKDSVYQKTLATKIKADGDDDALIDFVFSGFYDYSE